MSFNFSNTFKDLKSFGDKFTANINNEILPYAQRTTRIVQERMGKVDDISQLPEEYNQLANKCNNLAKMYDNILKITTIYESEDYDYPLNLNLQDTFSDFSKNITTKVSDLSKVTSTSEAQAVLINPSSKNLAKQPKTLYHALALATNPEILASDSTPLSEEQNDPLVKALTLYSSNLNNIANGRLGQDQIIKQKFNAPMRTRLRTLFQQSSKIQKKVEQKRVDYDLSRYNLSHARPDKEAQLRVIMENNEDEFANTVEDAVSIMKNVLEQGKPLTELLELIKAQLAYHKLASELLGGLVADVEHLAESNPKDVTAAQDFEI